MSRILQSQSQFAGRLWCVRLVMVTPAGKLQMIAGNLLSAQAVLLPVLCKIEGSLLNH